MSDRTHLCPRCESAQRAEARFCDQCGAAISSAGVKTQRLAGAGGPKGWREANLGLLGELAKRILGPAQAGRPAPLPADAQLDPPAPLTAPPDNVVPVGEWGACGAHQLCVSRAVRGIADDRRPTFVVEVAYRSLRERSEPTSKYHWRLCDSQGYYYESASYNGHFLGEEKRRLVDTAVLPGRVVRGWVAFVCPLDAPLSHLRFQLSYRARELREFALPEPELRDLAPKR